MKIYTIWNNNAKNGVSTITQLLAMEYAKTHKDVFVVDASQNCDLSKRLLGSEENLETCIETKNTISDLLIDLVSNKDASALKYFTQVASFNRAFPANIYLISGNDNSELIARNIDYKFGFKSRTLLKKLPKQKDGIMFIDGGSTMNPLSEMAILASDKIIIPFVDTIRNLRLLENSLEIIYNKKDDVILSEFVRRCKEHDIPVLKVSTIIRNKASITPLENTSLGKLVARYDDDINILSVPNDEVLVDCITHCGKPFPNNNFRRNGLCLVVQTERLERIENTFKSILAKLKTSDIKEL